MENLKSNYEKQKLFVMKQSSIKRFKKIINHAPDISLC